MTSDQGSLVAILGAGLARVVLGGIEDMPHGLAVSDARLSSTEPRSRIQATLDGRIVPGTAAGTGDGRDPRQQGPPGPGPADATRITTARHTRSCALPAAGHRGSTR